MIFVVKQWYYKRTKLFFIIFVYDSIQRVFNKVVAYVFNKQPPLLTLFPQIPANR